MPASAAPSAAPSRRIAPSALMDWFRSHAKQVLIGVATVTALGGTAIGLKNYNSNSNSGDQTKSASIDSSKKTSDKFLTLTHLPDGSTDYATNFDLKPGTYPVRGEDNRIIVIGLDGKPFYCTQEALVESKNNTRRETALCFEAINGSSNMTIENYPDPRKNRGGKITP